MFYFSNFPSWTDELQILQFELFQAPVTPNSDPQRITMDALSFYDTVKEVITLEVIWNSTLSSKLVNSCQSFLAEPYCIYSGIIHFSPKERALKHHQDGLTDEICKNCSMHYVYTTYNSCSLLIFQLYVKYSRIFAVFG